MRKLLISILLFCFIAFKVSAQYQSTQTHLLPSPLTTPMDVQVYDMNMDSLPDIIGITRTNGSTENTVKLYLNQGDKTFTLTEFGTKGGIMEQLTVGDVSGDGYPDIIAASSSHLQYWINDGNLNFTEFDFYTGTWLTDVSIGDIDNDNKQEVITSDLFGGEIRIYFFNNNTISSSLIDTAEWGANKAKIANLNADSLPDIIAAYKSQDEIVWYENIGQGFIKHVIDSSMNDPIDVAVSDINLDGFNDIAATSLNNGIVCYFQDSLGNFTKQQVEPDSTIAWSKDINIVDLNNDQLPDILSASETLDYVAFWENQGNNKFIKRIIAEDIGGPIGVAYGDFDMDNDLDVVCSAFWDYEFYWFEMEDITSDIDNSNASASFSIYPNPAQEILKISFDPFMDSGNLRVLSIDGKLIHSQELIDNNPVLNVKSLKPGMYLLQIETNNSNTIKRFIKK
ncbi:MAG: hypothetical protein ACJAUV_000283 [Flavobacteriales bacterium]|jgi:hypothetical protein